jgi:hypothetical protein
LRCWPQLLPEYAIDFLNLTVRCISLHRSLRKAVLDNQQDRRERVGPPEHSPIQLTKVCEVKFDTFQVKDFAKLSRTWLRKNLMKGYFTMPYDYLDPNKNLADDFWTIRGSEEG